MTISPGFFGRDGVARESLFENFGSASVQKRERLCIIQDLRRIHVHTSLVTSLVAGGAASPIRHRTGRRNQTV